MGEEVDGRDSASLSRRRFLGLAGALGAAGAVIGTSGAGASVLGGAARRFADPAFGARRVATPSLPANPFTLGVASGDPTADGFVLWTRLAPDPLAPGGAGGMDPVLVPVRWIVTRDENLQQVEREGTFVTSPAVAHSVHAVLRGLQPDRPYWYRFRVGDWESPVGRARTFPPRWQPASRLRFGFASCQSWTDGYYAAYRDLAADDLDLVVHLGDYIYEGGGSGVRDHDGPEIVTIDQYRNRYALYKGDADLQAAHALAPWLTTWDDHEADNNYAGFFPEADSITPTPEEFVARRVAAYRAWWEHMPVRGPAPLGTELRIRRRADFGSLARFHVLDTRQYRTDQPCAGSSVSDVGGRCAEAFADDAQMLGAEQEQWLFDGLDASSSVWNVLAQQIVFSQLAFLPGTPGVYNLDQWDGYVAARQRVLDFLADRRPANPVVITGDIHASGVSDVKADFDDPASDVLGTEFVGTSITSGSPSVFQAVLPLLLANNPHLKWADAVSRGWVRCEVTPDEWRTDYRFVADVTDPGSTVTTAKSWVVEAGGTVHPA